MLVASRACVYVNKTDSNCRTLTVMCCLTPGIQSMQFVPFLCQKYLRCS